MATAAVVAFLAYLALLAVAEVWPARVRLPDAVQLPAAILGVRQGWTMFIRPPTDDGWLIAAGRLANSRVHDVWRDAPLDAGKPPSVAATFGNSRWIKYLSQLNERDYVHHRRLFGDYLCRRWNERHAGADELTGLQLYFVLERTLPGGGEAAPQPMLLWQQSCPGTATASR